jgi:hypothetical protein
MAQVSRVPNTGRMQNKEHHAARAGVLLQPRLNSCHMDGGLSGCVAVQPLRKIWAIGIRKTPLFRHELWEIISFGSIAYV